MEIEVNKMKTVFREEKECILRSTRTTLLLRDGRNSYGGITVILKDPQCLVYREHFTMSKSVFGGYPVYPPNGFRKEVST